MRKGLYNYRYGIIVAVVMLVLSGTAITFATIRDDAKIEKVNAAKRFVQSGAVIIARERDLEEGKVVIAGEAVISGWAAVEKIEYSLDNGESWHAAEGMRPWRFKFTPAMGEEYGVLIHAVMSSGDRSPNFIAIVQYEPQAYRKIFEDIFKATRDVYIDERYREFMKFFNQDEYPNYATLCENMRN